MLCTTLVTVAHDDYSTRFQAWHSCKRLDNNFQHIVETGSILPVTTLQTTVRTLDRLVCSPSLFDEGSSAMVAIVLMPFLWVEVVFETASSSGLLCPFFKFPQED